MHGCTTAWLALTALLASVISVLAQTPAQDDPTLQARALNKFLAQNGYGWTSIDLSERNTEYINVSLNGDDCRLKIDTGAATSCISWSMAQALNLKVAKVKTEIVGIGGLMEGDEGKAVLASFKIGPYEINRTNPIVVLPGNANMGEYNAGFFGLDYLYLNQVILPVAQRIMFFKPGPRKRSDIRDFMTKLGFHGVPLGIDHHAGLVVSGDVDGHPLRAIVDCGAEFSTFDYDFIQKTVGEPLDLLRGGSRGVDGRAVAWYSFTPKSIHFGDFALPPEMLAASPGIAPFKNGVDALLGYDVLGPHHAILDFGRGVMWLR